MTPEQAERLKQEYAKRLALAYLQDWELRWLGRVFTTEEPHR